MIFKSHVRSGLLLVGIFSQTCISAPAAASKPTEDPVVRRSISNGVTLRILPLGDSITWGFQSSDGNGYRLDLQNMLSGNSVQYVGSQRSGSMPDNYNEGHPGAVIDQIATYAEASLPDRPNVILLMAGTNDCNQPLNPDTAPQRLGNLIDEVVAACPDAAVIVAQLTPIGHPTQEALVQTFNAAVPGIVASRANAGKQVLVVDMSSSVTADDLEDGLHPNDYGYNLMAETWYAGIQQASAKGWISQPVSGTIVNHGVGSLSPACQASLYWDPLYGNIASGVGSGDKAFSASWNNAGTLAGGYVGSGNMQGHNIRMADLDGDGKADYLYVDPKSGAVSLYLNTGVTVGKQVAWKVCGTVAGGIGDGPGVIFADINGDGLVDYLWVSESGDVTAYKNGGPGSGGVAGGTWLWYPLGVIATGLGGTRDTIRFADIDGDGRAEYLIVGDTGSLTGFFNGGFGDVPTWEMMGEIAGGIGDRAGVRLADLNNDGRADYIWLDSNGAATVYINYRGHSPGLAPGWVSAGVIASGIGTSRNNITFADLNGDGKSDYVFIHVPQGQVDVYLNQGSGGTYGVGEGIMFGDLDGDGREDYIWMNINGGMTLYTNGGFDVPSNHWVWYPQGEIASGVAPRKNIRLADLDGDGKSDYLVVDDTSGAIHFWQNGGFDSAANKWIWIDNGQVASGIGDGAGVQFADIDGDGKADYLWVDKNGAVTAYINGGKDQSNGNWIWYPQNVIATGVGAAREDVKFHDMNGDGKADYLWIDRVSGSLQVWHNGGGQPGNWIWYPQGELASGVGANGLCVEFADLTGDGRSDYLDVTPTSGGISMWFNGCSGGEAPPEPTNPVNKGPPPPPPWDQAQCTTPAVTNAALDQSVRWNSVDTETAWPLAIASWTSDENTGLTFSEQISNFFHGREEMECGVTDDHNGCDTTYLCSDVDHPAGYFILNSFVAVNNMNLNFYDAISRVEAQITAAISTVSKTFAPINDESEGLKLALDLIGLGFALAAAPIWNSFLKGFAFFKANPNTLGTVKDQVNPLVSNGITILKDTTISGQTLNAQNTLEENLGALITIWYNTIATVNKNIFAGDSASISTLYNMATQGKMLQPGPTPDDPQIQAAIENAIFGYLIPQAWSLSNEGVYPVVIDSGFDCSAVNPLPEYIDEDDGNNSWVCYENELYYMLSASGAAQNCGGGDGVGISCTDNTFVPPPGLDGLDGRAYGGVTRNDFVIGAVNSFKANGNKNGWPAADPSSDTTLSALYDTGIQTPGIIMIPVCGPDEALNNWINNAYGDKTYPNYPCNK